MSAGPTSTNSRSSATGDYRFRDVFLLPGLFSLSRIPLAALFPLVVDRPLLAFGLLALSGFTDVLDGWAARRFGQATPTGAALDPVTDKIFVLTVAITLVVTGHLSVGTVLLLSTREIGELPLVVWFATSPRARGARAEKPRANAAGKLATVLQFAAVSAALLRSDITDVLVWTTAAAGTFAAVSYWRRALSLGARDAG